VTTVPPTLLSLSHGMLPGKDADATPEAAYELLHTTEQSRPSLNDLPDSPLGSEDGEDLPRTSSAAVRLPQRWSVWRVIIVGVVVGVSVLVLLATAFFFLDLRRIRVPDGKGGLVKVDVALPPDFYDRSVADFYKPYRDHMFAPWVCPDDDAAPDSLCRRPITTHAITALEYLALTVGYRIRYTGKDILYRPLHTFRQTYKVNRLVWVMKAMREMADEGMLTRTVDGIEGKQLLSPDYYDFEAFRGCAEHRVPLQSLSASMRSSMPVTPR
jgi:hypothetical protein